MHVCNSLSFQLQQQQQQKTSAPVHVGYVGPSLDMTGEVVWIPHLTYNINRNILSTLEKNIYIHIYIYTKTTQVALSHS